MEQQEVSSEDEEPNVTEEKIVTMIFSECDTEGRGKVPVLKLMHFMLSQADQKLDRSVLEELKLMLDPQESNVEVTRQTFHTAMRTWTEEMKKKSNDDISCMDDADPCNAGTIDPGQISDGDPAEYPVSDLHNSSNISSFSCSSNEPVTLPHAVETNALMECVMELNYSKKRLEEQNEDLQTQLHASEDGYALLQKDYKKMCLKLSSLQGVMQQFHQLQKECEELKEAAVAAETAGVVLKLREQELEKEARVNRRQLSELENQKMELVLELEVSSRKNQEVQKTVTLQKMEIEQLLKQCRQHEHLNGTQADHILELKGRVDELLSSVQHLQEDKQSLEVCLLSMEDELLSVHSQASLVLSRRTSLVGNENISNNEDDMYVSARSSPYRFVADNHDSLQAEIEAVNKVTDREVQCEWSLDFRNQESQTAPVSAEDVAREMRSVVAQASPDNSMILGEESCSTKQHSVLEEASDPTSDFLWLDVQNLTLFNPDTQLAKWVRDTDALIAVRRKTNLQARPGGVCDVFHMEQPEPSGDDEMPGPSPAIKRASSVNSASEEQEGTSSMRRCMSESQVVRSGSETSSGSSSPSDVFPSLPDVVLQELGLASAVATQPCDILSEQDIENRFSTLSLAFRTDKLTLVSRHERQQRQRDQAEKNMAAEVMKLKAAVHNLNYLCKDSESIEILGKIQDQVDVLQQSTERVSSSAEIFGAVQQESRVSKAIEVMLTHVENLKRMYEKEHTELEETKRVLLENNLVVDGSADSTDASQRNARHRALNALAVQGKQRRRASIAVFRVLGSPDSTKTSNTSLTFGDTKRGAPHSRRTLSSHVESAGPGWDSTDRLERQEMLGGSMDDIEEVVDGRRESSVDLEEQSTTLEENNNCTSTVSRKSSRCDGTSEVGSEDVTFSFGNTDNNPTRSCERTEDCAVDSDCSPPSLTRNLGSLRSFRDCAREFICEMHTTIVECMVPMNVDYVLIQTRRCATLLLLFAALWSLVSTFVPTTAQSSNCVPFSWLTLKDILLPYTQLRHYGPPPT
ncbi:Lymphoid-restricted membrane protein [Zootermopsis nevadensis]|uniref:Lymphoid-restricted membrane protein n=2 Tax=Zootermopsis nevadensis TaxID=136037 RepID=A0A067RG09_ZOONE|nr:Lymphoid-restricted membrane protein [Zootermopsis nevadensis]